MARKGLRRLELRLPDSHPIWSLPPRTRAPVARAYLDLLSVEMAQSRLLEEILRRLERLERAAEGSEGRRPPGDRPGPAPEREAGGRGFDAAEFFAAFD